MSGDRLLSDDELNDASWNDLTEGAEYPDGSSVDTPHAARPKVGAKRIKVIGCSSMGWAGPKLFIEGYGFVNDPPRTLYRKEVVLWKFPETQD